MSDVPFESLGARFGAFEANATNRPSVEMVGLALEKKGDVSTPYVASEIRIVVFCTVSRRKTSSALFVSLKTRSGELDWKTTHRPSLEMSGAPPPSDASLPWELTETRRVVFRSRSRTNTSATLVPLPSARTRSAAVDTISNDTATT